MTRVTGADVHRTIASLDPARDGYEISRLSLVTLHGHPPLVYALFTVAFLKQVAVPTMARTLYRRGTGDIVRSTIERNDDTIVFFGQLLDHGPDSETGRAWIDRLNQIHAHFPLRNQDSLYTLATLALDPHEITASLGASPFTSREREAHWMFWRAVAVRQHIEDVPATAAELREWSRRYELLEYEPSREGRAIAAALIEAFGERCLPRPLRPQAARIISVFCPPALREVHALPEPGPVITLAIRAAFHIYVRTLRHRRLDASRSLVQEFGDRRYGPRRPEEVGYHRHQRPDKQKE
ncbi:oxygenase MpaB family protein [Nocardia elegans]|uniref:Oxygenase MpaB family protein n=1 Tax=Nocardia elegans TaxID=300029 RepID=A0ABW6TTU5_9NOCA